ncbi:glucan phosphoethanolaminetransferase (alkaline phosphatase superfamily) [Peptoniphilus olsenii]|uniref:Glucan phosphoethanolaminetransferase (Alkaline phosphatase superfamily) n=1 Tax=Peptoniphilus olsenii TaxID=411570 RepID=A0ABV2J902_9FIRM
MSKYIMNFYNKGDKEKALCIFFVYLISGILFLSIGEMPEIYTNIAVLNIKIVVPFLLGFLLFLPVLFKKRLFVLFLIVLYIPHVFWFYFFIHSYSFYIPIAIGILFGIYTRYIIKNYKD